MKSITTKLAIVVSCMMVLLSSCERLISVVPSPDISIQERSVSTFLGVEVSDAINVIVIYSDTEDKVEVEANDNLHGYILIENVGDILRIKVRNNTNIRRNPTIIVCITSTNPMEILNASGASTISLQNTVEQDEVHIDLSGASIFSGTIDAITASFTLSGASRVSMDGSVTEIELYVSGASQVNGLDLNATYADVNLSGASDASLTVVDEINLDASGASIFRYKGSAQINQINLSGASKIVKID